MTKDEIALIVGWLSEPESFDFMLAGNLELLTKVRQSLFEIVADKKQLFWAVPVHFSGHKLPRPQIVEVSAYLYGGEFKLQVMCIGEDSIYKYNDFRDYTPIAAPPPVSSPS